MYKLRIFTPLFYLFPFHINVFLCVKSVYDNIVQNLSSSIWFRNRIFTETMFMQRRGIFVNLPEGDVFNIQTRNILQFLKNAVPPLPKLAFFIKGWNCTGDELCRSHLFMRKKMSDFKMVRSAHTCPLV